MVGNPGEPEQPEEKPVPVDPETPPPPSTPKIRSFSCTACGAPVTIRYPGATMSVVCDSCHSVIDVTDKNYEILSRYFSKASLWTPTIPLNSRGKLDGKTWEVIGFMVRSDVASKYYWMEYLLFNPYYGYRFLTQDKGHWIFVSMIKRKPKNIYSTSVRVKTPANVELDNCSYRIFNRGITRVDYVIGEFYWRVVVGSEVTSADYIAPPQMLSFEYDDTEQIWSLGKHVDSKEVEKAFKLPPKVADPIGFGLGAIEPSASLASWKKMVLLWVVFLGFLTCACIFFAGTAKNMTASQFYGNFVPNTKINDITIPKFVLEKNSANVMISLYAPVSNSWFYVSGEMVNNATGASYPFEMTSEYYFGTDSDGAWSEGNATHELTFSSVPGGEYYLNIDTESGDFKNTNQQQFSIFVKRDVPSWYNYWWFVFMVSIPPIYSWIMMRRDEVSRWSNSDFNPYVSDS